MYIIRIATLLALAGNIIISTLCMGSQSSTTHHLLLHVLQPSPDTMLCPVKKYSNYYSRRSPLITHISHTKVQVDIMKSVYGGHPLSLILLP